MRRKGSLCAFRISSTYLHPLLYYQQQTKACIPGRPVVYTDFTAPEAVNGLPSFLPSLRPPRPPAIAISGFLHHSWFLTNYSGSVPFKHNHLPRPLFNSTKLVPRLISAPRLVHVQLLNHNKHVDIEWLLLHLCWLPHCILYQPLGIRWF